jgi:AraC family transcriptional regulator of adaptative response / DNA-3-methyladenine glycosylase II
MEREMGVSPVELAQTHRLLLAKRLLADTTLPVTRIAFASGFQSLRRFNSVFRERYRMSPSVLRGSESVGTSSRETPTGARSRRSTASDSTNDLLRLTLAYRPPLAWDVLVALLRQEVTPGVEVVIGGRFARTICLEGRSGIIVAENASGESRDAHRAPKTHLNIDISSSLLPALMPLLARLRRLFDLDAEPSVVDDYLEKGGLGAHVRRHPGLRIPGAFDGFEVALVALLRGAGKSPAATALVARVVAAFGEPIETSIASLTRLMPSAHRVAGADASCLAALGVPMRRAEAIVAVARAVADGELQLEPGREPEATIRQLTEISGVSARLATTIAMRALNWPDAFPDSDRALQRAAGVTGKMALRSLAERWRPWRAYAAIHLWLEEAAGQAR